MKTAEKFKTMKMRRLKVEPTDIPAGRVDERRLDATTEEDIARQREADDADSMKAAAKYARGEVEPGKSNH